MTTPLCTLAKQYGSDKGPDFHNYTPMYYEIMCGMNYQVKKVLEVGVGKGPSIQMWLDFFPTATVYALDFSQKALDDLMKCDNPGIKRVVPLLGDQKDPNLWNLVGDDFDFIIDDGSHVPEDQITTFTNNFHKVRSHGFWIIEDTHCNYHPAFNGTFLGDDRLYPWLSSRLRAQQMYPSWDGDFYKEILKCETTDPLTKMIFGVRCYKSLIMFEKA